MKEATASPKDAALKLALDALEIYGAQAPAVRQTITAIKAALAQQDQEPVGYIDAETLRRWDSLKGTAYECDEKCYMPFSRKAPHKSDIVDCSLPVYISPQQRTWVGLTDEGIQTIHDMYYRRMGPQEFARAIEAKLKEKNI